MVIVGGGPAGLMAADTLARGKVPGLSIHVHDAMPSVGRKFLLAGKGGLNLTHAEPPEAFLSRYGIRRPALERALHDLGPDALRAFAGELGIATFVGSSGRVFPDGMKAAPLLRAWLHRLRESGVQFHVRSRWLGWDEQNRLRFSDAQAGETRTRCDATILALGGASWPQLGSDGTWVGLLEDRGISIVPLAPSNCGFDVAWSEVFRRRFAGTPVKRVLATAEIDATLAPAMPGEFMITEHGIEGGIVYALSARLRDAIASTGSATIRIDLAPARTREALEAALQGSRGKRSLSEYLRRRARLDPVRIALLREVVAPDVLADAATAAATIKNLPLRLGPPRPVTEAISTAGGVPFEALDENLMIRALPGVFCAGEMLDWESPTGGYLLTACFATGHAAGGGAMRWLQSRASASQNASTSDSVL